MGLFLFPFWRRAPIFFSYPAQTFSHSRAFSRRPAPGPGKPLIPWQYLPLPAPGVPAPVPGLDAGIPLRHGGLGGGGPQFLIGDLLYPRPVILLGTGQGLSQFLPLPAQINQPRLGRLDLGLGPGLPGSPFAKTAGAGYPFVPPVFGRRPAVGIGTVPVPLRPSGCVPYWPGTPPGGRCFPPIPLPKRPGGPGAPGYGRPH